MRCVLLLLDSLGVGASLDAVDYGDSGADTLGHIVFACAQGQADDERRQGPLQIPHLAQLGLYHVATASTGVAYSVIEKLTPQALFGYAVEQSVGKDTPSGHWELMGLPVMERWGHFHDQTPCFPDELLQPLCERAQLPGVLANTVGSGTHLIDQWADEHIRTGQPIVYTSADSVLQIAAHEQHFGLERLYQLCHWARELADRHRIARVIARPFVGANGVWQRTGHRRDYTMPPPADTLLDRAQQQGYPVVSVGKTADIFAHRGCTQSLPATGLDALWDATLQAMASTDRGIVFTNFVDFDSHYGHRRDVVGYAHALERWDRRLPELLSRLTADDLLIITADHGCDPTFPGYDHTREHVPVLFYGQRCGSGWIGRRDTFADVGQTMAEFLQLPPLAHGVSCLGQP